MEMKNPPNIMLYGITTPNDEDFKPSINVLYGVDFPNKDKEKEVPQIFKIVNPDKKFIEDLRKAFYGKINCKKYTADEIKIFFEQSINEILLKDK